MFHSLKKILDDHAIYWRSIILLFPSFVLVVLFNQLISTNIIAILVGSMFSLAFGIGRSFNRWRWDLLVLTTVLSSCFTVIGSILDYKSLWFYIVLASLSLLCSVVNLKDNNYWWVVNKCILMFVIASYHHGTVESAFERGVVVLISGLLIVINALIVTILLPNESLLPAKTITSQLPLLNTISYTVTMLVVVIAAVTIASSLNYHYSYWSAIAALNVVRISYKQTLNYIWQSAAGVMIGSSIAILILLCTKDIAIYWTIVLLAIFLAVASLKLPYFYSTTFTSLAVIILLDIIFADPLDIVKERIISYIIGCLISFVITTIGMGIPLCIQKLKVNRIK